MSAQEEERSRVARDLHDTVAQDLAALRLEIERVASHSGAELRGELERLEGRARDMLDCVRRILLDLRLSVLEGMGFLPAMRWLLERIEREHGIRTQFVVDGDETMEPTYQRAVTLFRILQESLLNVVHHAAAENVFCTVNLEPDAIELTVEDDGRGFDVTERGPRLEGRPGGLGILGMEERAHLLGGTLAISSSEGEGTTIHVRVPTPGESREVQP
jgi:signal transduction histidine kinase